MRAAVAAAALWALCASACVKRLAEGEVDRTRLPRIELPWVGPERYHPAMLERRVVLVHFTATWCFPCLSELPNLEALQKRFADKGFQLVAIGLDIEGKRVLEPFAYHYRLPFPILVADDAYRKGESRFGHIAGVPAYALYGRDGRVIAAWSGPAPYDQLTAAVESALR